MSKLLIPKTEGTAEELDQSGKDKEKITVFGQVILHN
jgi:hypothetical protein